VIGISVHYLPRCTKGDSDNLAQKMDAWSVEALLTLAYYSKH
jgi:hypothetical protein